MNTPASCNVYSSHFVKESVLAPKPVSGDAVDDRVDQGEQAVGVKVAP
jgi:hypothetical protein